MSVISSVYQINDFPTDRDEVIMERIKQSDDMKLLTIHQDYKLHQKLQAWGVDDSRSINMWDYLQGAINYKNQDADYDFRVFPRYDKREVVLAPVSASKTADKNPCTSIAYRGQVYGNIKYQEGHVERTREVDLFDGDHRLWAKDFYDYRGFLSRRQYLNPDGKVGLETIFHVDGTPIIEISHMMRTVQVRDVTGQIKQERVPAIMYRLLGTHGLPNWLLNNELSLGLWWINQLVKSGDVIYNHDPSLDTIWLQLEPKIKLNEVAHIQDLNQDRINQLKARENVITPNPYIAKQNGYTFKDAWVNGQPVRQAKKFDRNRVAGFGRWITNDLVDQMLVILNGLHQARPKVKVDLIGWFTTDTEKYFRAQAKKLGIDKMYTVRGNVVGDARRKILQNDAVAWCWANVNESDVILKMINHYGVPVVTNIPGFRGARITGNQPKFFVQGLLMGLAQIDTWRADVKKFAK